MGNPRDAIRSAPVGPEGAAGGRPDSRSPGQKALSLLAFSPKKGAQIIKKVLESGDRQRRAQRRCDIDELKVKKIFVEKGIPLKRFHARAKGGATA